MGLWGGVRAAEVGTECAGRNGSGLQEQIGQELETHLVSWNRGEGVGSV